MARGSSFWCAASLAGVLAVGCRAPVVPEPSAPEPVPTEVARAASSFVLAQLGTGAFRLHGPLDGVAFVPDGKRIVAVSQTAGVYVFDRATGRVTMHLPFEGDIADMALLPDGDSLLVSGRGGVHRYSLHEQAEGTPVLPVETQTGAIDVDADGEHVVVTDGGAALRVVSVETGDELATFGGFADYRDVMFVPRTDWVAASLSDRVGLWNWRTGDREHQLPSQNGRFAVGADGRWVAVVGYGTGHEVSVWSLDNGERRHVLSVGSTGYLASTPDGGLLLVNEDTNVGVWDVRTGQRRLSLAPTSSYDRTMAVSGDGTMLAAGGNDHTIGLWSLTDGSYQTPQSGHRGEVLELAFSPEGDRLMSASYGDQRAIVWGLNEGRALFDVEVPEGFGAAAFDPKDGGLVVVEHAGGMRDERLVRMSETGEELGRWNASLSLVRDAHWLPDGQLALAEGGQISVMPIDGRSAAWQSDNLFDDPDLTTDAEADFSEDGSQAVVYGGSRWMVVDVAAKTVGRRGSVATCRFIEEAAIAAGGNVVVGSETEFRAEDSLVIVWRSGARERALPIEGNARALVSDRDARRIAFLAKDSIGVWDPIGGRVWTVERTVPTALAMTPDGERLAVGFGNGTVEVWDVDALMRRVEARDAPAPDPPEPCPEESSRGFGVLGTMSGRPAAEIYEGMFAPPAD